MLTLSVCVVLAGTMLRLSPPTQHDVDHLVAASALSAHNYEPVGITRRLRDGAQMATRAPMLASRRIALDADLGRGRGVYMRAVRALYGLRMHDGSPTRGITRVSRPTLSKGARARVGEGIATWARSSLGVYCVNPCRIVYEERTRSSATLAYGTLVGHWLAGEESMRVHWDRGTDRVTFSLLSLSRGSGLVGEALFRFLGRMQMAFFAEQCETMRRIVRVSPELGND